LTWPKGKQTHAREDSQHTAAVAPLVVIQSGTEKVTMPVVIQNAGSQALLGLGIPDSALPIGQHKLGAAISETKKSQCVHNAER
jgi:hypothetical protein